MKESTNILGIKFNNITLREAAEILFSACKSNNVRPFTVVTPNPIMVMNAQKDKDLLSALLSADLSLADGVGVISAARRLGFPLPERVTGIDTGYAVLEKLAEIGGSIYLLGAKPGVAELAAEKLTGNLTGLRVVGTHNGYFANDEEIIKAITKTAPDLLIVCLGSPRQEIWVNKNKNKLSGIGAVICLGGALDVWAGKIKRAPRLFINLRLEWLWRMLCEPKRMKNLPLMLKFRLLTRKTRQKARSFK